MTRSKQTAEPEMVLIAVLAQRLKVQGPFVAKRVVKTLPCNPHFAHQYVQRRMLVAKTPEDVRCRLQCLPRLKFFCSSDSRLCGLIYTQSIQIYASLAFA